MRDDRAYKHAHKLGKLLAWVISTVILMFLLHDVTTLERVLWAAFNLLYWFGANTFAYIIEEIEGLRHQHDKF